MTVLALGTVGTGPPAIDVGNDTVSGDPTTIPLMALPEPHADGRRASDRLSTEARLKCFWESTRSGGPVPRPREPVGRRGGSSAVVGMAAKPLGAHQAGRHRAGRKGILGMTEPKRMRDVGHAGPFPNGKRPPQGNRGGRLRPGMPCPTASPP
jgi:hypothetical protein